MEKEDDYLVTSYDISSFTFSKPKKVGDHMISKIKNKDGENIFVQFPRMLVVSEENSKNVQLEFTAQTGYNKKVDTFLDDLDNHVIDYVTKNSEDWFGKKVKVSKMYKRKQLQFNLSKAEITYKGEEVEHVNKGVKLECIAQLKYIVFSKDSSFVSWEINTAKMHKKVLRVGKFGFVDDPDDKGDISDDDEIGFF
jgi:hypothetical protein